MKKYTTALLHSPFAITVILILLIAAASFATVSRVNAIEEQRALDTLYVEAEALAQDIRVQVDRDREQLEMFASIAARYSDFQDPQLWRILEAFSLNGMMEEVAILLPDNSVVASGERRLEALEDMTYEEVAARGVYISGRQVSLTNGSYILRHYVPVMRDGNVVAMLYGVVDLSGLPDDLIISPYGGQASVYIIDGDNGDFLLDTWHRNETLGNFLNMGGRQMAPGYDNDTSLEEMFSGMTGHVVFVSRTTGDYLYFHYRSVGVSNWILALSVSEDLVFSYANTVRTLLNILLILEAVFFALYFLWVFISMRRQTGEKQKQVDALNNVYEISKLLFAAHERQENIPPALQLVSRHTGSRAALLWASRLGDEGTLYSWREDEGKTNVDYLGYLKEYFLSGQKYFESRGSFRLRGILHSKSGRDITALCAIALEDEKGELCGFLAVENPSEVGSVRSLLGSVSPSFSMLCRNLRGYSRIRARGETDSLTGLLNRNRYERDCPLWQMWYSDSLACVYIDANGLHELNNTKGHAAGDEMLKNTAAAIMRIFGKKHSYRIGGDEFVSFVSDRTQSAVIGMCNELQAALQAKGIEVALGMQYSDSPTDLASMVTAAEKKMYVAKQSWYAERAERR